jgi:DNA-binding LytR/AlgR family response regulator
LNTKLKCLLLDDELPGLSYLKILCEQMPELEVIKSFNDSEVFLKEFDTLDFDLCFLDIEMPGISGIQLAALLKGKPVIFTTAYKDYATDAFDLNAIDYVIKPVKPERLQQAVNKAIHRINSENNTTKHIQLNTDKGIALIDVSQFVYARTSEIDSRDKIALLSNGTILQLKNISFEKLISLLPSAAFCRVNKKELIQMSTVLFFSNDQISTNIYFQSEKLLNITLGETYRNSFISKING